MLVLQEKNMLILQEELGSVRKGQERIKGVDVWMEGQEMKSFFH